MKKLTNTIQSLPPSSFAMVMATGIVATASHLQHFTIISKALFWLNNGAFLLLLVLFLLRFFFYATRVRKDIASHEKGAGFLTLVAGACVLGTEHAQSESAYGIAIVLGIAGLVAWLVILYGFLASVILKSEKPSPETGMNGGWLLLVVSTQSLSILSGAIRPGFENESLVLLSFSVFFFLLAVFFYLIVITIDFYRLLFFPVLSNEVAPSYWINMGAAAITSLSGTVLASSLHGNGLFADFYFFVKAAALLFWCVGTFWIPLVLILEVWRYGFKQKSLRYEAGLWSLVFPLGMYTVCCWHLPEILPLPFFTGLASGFLYTAWTAWLLTFAGLCHHWVQRTTPEADRATAAESPSME